MTSEVVKKRVEEFNVLGEKVYRLTHPTSHELVGFKIVTGDEIHLINSMENIYYHRHYKREKLFKKKLVEKTTPLEAINTVTLVKMEFPGMMQWSKSLGFSFSLNEYDVLKIQKGEVDSEDYISRDYDWKSFDYTIYTGPHSHLNEKALYKVPGASEQHFKELAAVIAAIKPEKTVTISTIAGDDVSKSLIAFDPDNKRTYHRDARGQDIEMLGNVFVYSG
jgi:hypothetical protein